MSCTSLIIRMLTAGVEGASFSAFLFKSSVSFFVFAMSPRTTLKLVKYLQSDLSFSICLILMRRTKV